MDQNGSHTRTVEQARQWVWSQSLLRLNFWFIIVPVTAIAKQNATSLSLGGDNRRSRRRSSTRKHQPRTRLGRGTLGGECGNPPLRWKCVRNAAASAAAFVRDLPRNHVNNLSSAYIVVVPVVELFLKTSRVKRAFFTFPAKFPLLVRSFLCLHNTGPLMTHCHMVTRRPPTSSTAQQPSDSKSTRLATSPQNLVPAARYCGTYPTFTSFFLSFSFASYSWPHNLSRKRDTR